MFFIPIQVLIVADPAFSLLLFSMSAVRCDITSSYVLVCICSIISTQPIVFNDTIILRDICNRAILHNTIMAIDSKNLVIVANFLKHMNIL